MPMQEQHGESHEGEIMSGICRGEKCEDKCTEKLPRASAAQEAWGGGGRCRGLRQLQGVMAYSKLTGRSPRARGDHRSDIQGEASSSF